jgi:hypothetical protein
MFLVPHPSVVIGLNPLPSASCSLSKSCYFPEVSSLLSYENQSMCVRNKLMISLSCVHNFATLWSLIHMYVYLHSLLILFAVWKCFFFFCSGKECVPSALFRSAYRCARHVAYPFFFFFINRTCIKFLPQGFLGLSDHKGLEGGKVCDHLPSTPKTKGRT